MKKILFSLVALMCCMSINAQVMKVMKNGEVVKTYTAAEVNEVVFEAGALPASTTGTAMRTGDIEVRWVQLWEGGPKFAEYNVGAENNKAEDYGGYYCWGGSIDKDPDYAYKEGSDALTGTNDTATNLWGSNWRMPTLEEIKALRECDAEWTTISGVSGYKITGKGDFSSNSVFLPAAGYYRPYFVPDLGKFGQYFSSTPYQVSYAHALYFQFDNKPGLTKSDKNTEGSVRAVLAE